MRIGSDALRRESNSWRCCGYDEEIRLAWKTNYFASPSFVSRDHPTISTPSGFSFPELKSKQLLRDCHGALHRIRAHIHFHLKIPHDLKRNRKGSQLALPLADHDFHTSRRLPSRRKPTNLRA